MQLFGTPAAAATVTKQPVPAVAGVATNATKPKASSTSSSSVLSESVGITEEVVVKPADPVAVAVQESTDTADTVATSATTSIIQNTTISDMSVTGGGIVTYSDFIATSAPGIPATTQSSEHTKQKPQTPFFLGIATSPHTVLEILYVVIGLFVLCSLLISIFIEMRHQHPWQIGYGFALLVLMFGLFYVQSLLVGGVIIA